MSVDDAELQPSVDDGDDGPPGSLAGDFARSPVLQTLCLMTLGWVAVLVSGLSPESIWTAAPPVDRNPITLLTAVYAHASAAHLIGNALVVGTAGTIVARKSSPIRFHLFFVAAGVASTAVAVWLSTVGSSTQPQAYVLGASGAALALLGYLLAANFLSDRLSGFFGWNRTTGVVLLAVLTALLTVQFAGPGVANVSHAFGAFVGLVAGRLHLLRVR